MTPHIHHDCIVAWAKGAQIQVRIQGVWKEASDPMWYIDNQYRIKPEPKPDLVETRLLGTPDSIYVTCNRQSDSVRATYDGETGKLKHVEIVNV